MAAGLCGHLQLKAVLQEVNMLRAKEAVQQAATTAAGAAGAARTSTPDRSGTTDPGILHLQAQLNSATLTGNAAGSERADSNTSAGHSGRGASGNSSGNGSSKSWLLGGGKLNPEVLPSGLRSGHLFRPSPDGTNENLLVLLHGLGDTPKPYDGETCGRHC